MWKGCISPPMQTHIFSDRKLFWPVSGEPSVWGALKSKCQWLFLRETLAAQCQAQPMSEALPAFTTDLVKFDLLHLKTRIIIPSWCGSRRSTEGQERLCNFMIYQVPGIFSPRSSKWELLQFILIQIKQLSQKERKEKKKKGSWKVKKVRRK